MRHNHRLLPVLLGVIFLLFMALGTAPPAPSVTPVIEKVLYYDADGGVSQDTWPGQMIIGGILPLF